MSNVFESVQGLVRAGLVRVSEHAYDELAEDQATVREVVTGVAGGIEIEVYPEYPKGPLYTCSAER